MKIHLSLALSFLLAGCGVLGSGPLTQANLDKIHDDMSPTEVKAILGEPSDSRSEPIPIIGGSQTVYTYRTDSAEVTIVFKNDLVKEKLGSFDR